MFQTTNQNYTSVLLRLHVLHVDVADADALDALHHGGMAFHCYGGWASEILHQLVEP